MKYQFFKQIPKFAPEKHWAEDGVHKGAHGASLKASYWVNPDYLKNILERILN